MWICSLQSRAGISANNPDSNKDKKPYFPCRATGFDSKLHFPLPFPSLSLWVSTPSPGRSVPSETHCACSENPPEKATYIHPVVRDYPGNHQHPTPSWSMRKAEPSALLTLGLLFVARKITLICDHINPEYHMDQEGWTVAKPSERTSSGGENKTTSTMSGLSA